MQIDGWPADLYSDSVDDDIDREDPSEQSRGIINGIVLGFAIFALTGFWLWEAM